MIWLAMLVPAITAGVLYHFFKQKMMWWEFLVPFAISIICILVGKHASVSSQVKDKEFWGGYATHATYYEAWDEEVPCSHPTYCTRSVSRTDSKGNSYTTTETYQCGWDHLYDVDYHSEYWQMTECNGFTLALSRDYFESLAKRWGNRTFKDMSRNYHSIDGDKYVTKWDAKDETLEPVVTEHTYKNKVQASRSVFNFQDVLPEDVADYGLYEYPGLSGYACDAILGSGPRKGPASRYMDIWNAKLGPKRQLRMWILVFQGQPIDAALLQENYWKGGNKNEYVVCVGADKDWNITWCRPFSWTEADIITPEIRDGVMAMGKLDLEKVAKLMVPVLDGKFRRKEFADFDYLSVPPTGFAVGMTFLVTILFSVGISFYLVQNEFEEDGKVSRGRRSGYVGGRRGIRSMRFGKRR